MELFMLDVTAEALRAKVADFALVLFTSAMLFIYITEGDELM